MPFPGRSVLLLNLALLSGLGCTSGDASPSPRRLSPSAARGHLSPTGNLAIARATHTATLLPNGKVLITGGMERAGATAEIYDPGSGSFGPAAGMVFERAGGHTAVLLPTGKVLLAGGWSAGAVTRSAELYDPADGTFAATGTLNSPRSGYTASLLSTGRVLIAGGFDGTLRLAGAEIYDPNTGTFTPTGTMDQARAEHAAALLPDGRVLVTGGNRSPGHVLATAEIYDPDTGVFQRTGDMSVVRHKHAAAALPDGQVLIVGGSDARDWRGRHATTEIYHPARGSFSPGPRMNAERFKVQHAVVILRTGEVLVAGGDEQVEVHEPGSAVFRITTGELSADLSFSTATLLPDGRVLIAGGYDVRIQATARAWLYRPERE